MKPARCSFRPSKTFKIIILFVVWIKLKLLPLGEEEWARFLLKHKLGLGHDVKS